MNIEQILTKAKQRNAVTKTFLRCDKLLHDESTIKVVPRCAQLLKKITELTEFSIVTKPARAKPLQTLQKIYQILYFYHCMIRNKSYS